LTSINGIIGSIKQQPIQQQGALHLQQPHGSRQLYICIIIPFSATNPPLDEDPAGVLYHLCGLLLLLHWSACSFALVPGPHPSAVHATPSPHGKLHNVLYYDVVFISTTIIIYPLGPRPPQRISRCIIA